MALIQSERTNKTTGVTAREERYYISNLRRAEKKLNGQIRSHWGIENLLHWTLDMSFGEDKSRKRAAGNAAQNYSMLLRIVLNVLKNEKSSRRSSRGKQLKVAWDTDYFLKLLLLLKN